LSIVPLLNSSASTRVALALLLAACAAPERVAETKDPIYGGAKATIGQFPTVVLVDFTDPNNPNGEWGCTGTLVAPNIVLTAAHCVSPTIYMVADQATVTKGMTVVFDDNDVTAASPPGAFQIAAANTIGDPKFNPNMPALGHDFGFVILSTPVYDRTPAAISRKAANAPPGTSVTIVGFGNDQNNVWGVENYLANKVTESCAAISADDTNFLCWSQTDKTGTCEGDSGGPAFVDVAGVQTIVGVTSMGDKACALWGEDNRPEVELAFLDSVICASDGVCVKSCGQNGAPPDPDCANGIPCSQCLGMAQANGAACSATWQTCKNNPDCVKLVQCINACGAVGSCTTMCRQQFPNGQADLDADYDCLCGPATCGQTCMCSPPSASTGASSGSTSASASTTGSGGAGATSGAGDTSATTGNGGAGASANASTGSGSVDGGTGHTPGSGAGSDDGSGGDGTKSAPSAKSGCSMSMTGRPDALVLAAGLALAALAALARQRRLVRATQRRRVGRGRR
jgi:hypothetical protein